jgi:hypothetical protein
LEIYLENILDDDIDNLESSLQSLLENDKDVLSNENYLSSDDEMQSEEEDLLRLKKKFKYLIQIRDLMKENEKMKEENNKINDEIIIIRRESEIADINLIKIRQEFEQGRIDNIRVK